MDFPKKSHIYSDNNQADGKPDQEIIRLALNNQEYFAFIIKRYENRLYRYIKRISNFSNEDTEDVLQEIFIKVFKNINDYNQDLKFSSWIYRIARNHTISKFRKTKVRGEDKSINLDDNLIRKLSSDLDIAKNTDNKILNKNINKVLNMLEKKYQEVLVLRYFEELDYKEMADILQKPMGTIATLINRAKDKFKDELKKQNIKL